MHGSIFILFFFFCIDQIFNSQNSHSMICRTCPLLTSGEVAMNEVITFPVIVCTSKVGKMISICSSNLFPSLPSRMMRKFKELVSSWQVEKISLKTE